jgi:hypothetical protein
MDSSSIVEIARSRAALTASTITREPMSTPLDRARSLAVEARDLELRKKNLEEELTRANKRLSSIYFDELVTALDDAGVDTLGVKPSGNMPGFDVVISSHVSANISSRWPEDRRRQAFQWLEANGYQDLIKTEVIAAFPREERSEALRFAEEAREHHGSPVIRESVHQQTLTAWLKDLFRSGEVMPPLDVIGGSIARVARLKERSDG